MDLEQIYREQYRPLVAFLVRRLGDPARAEELAQEAFVRAIRHRPRQPRAWLYAVAGNLARDEIRHRSAAGRHLRVVTDVTVDEVPAADRDPERAALGHERGRRAQRALSSLAERDRQALLMKESGESYAEIAARLGLSPGSVGTTLSRARRRLLEAWERAGEADDVAR